MLDRAEKNLILFVSESVNAHVLLYDIQTPDVQSFSFTHVAHSRRFVLNFFYSQVLGRRGGLKQRIMKA